MRAGIERLPAVGVPLEAITTWLSDGSRTYPAVLAMLNPGGLPRQRSIIHLWRNVLGAITAYGALFILVETYGHDPLARPIVDLVRATFPEATYHLKDSTRELSRTTEVVEWLWRRFKRRMRLIQVFMSDESPDRFVALFELYVNFHRYQIRRECKRHYPYPGMCPLEIAGQFSSVRPYGLPPRHNGRCGRPHSGGSGDLRYHRTVH